MRWFVPVGAMNWHAVSVAGLMFAILGAIVFTWGAAVMVRANRSYHGPSEGQHRSEKVAHLAGGSLLLIGFALQFGAAVAR